MTNDRFRVITVYRVYFVHSNDPSGVKRPVYASHASSSSSALTLSRKNTLITINKARREYRDSDREEIATRLVIAFINPSYITDALFPVGECMRATRRESYISYG